MVPSQAGAWQGGWHRGWWAGRSWYAGRALYYPYSPFYYPNYAFFYPPYAYYPEADYSAQDTFYSAPNSEFGALRSEQAESPHPTGGAPVAPPDAGLIRLRVPDQFAEVLFNGQRISSVGTKRDYVTPPLHAGKTYRYTISVAWGQGDQQTTREQTIDIARGLTRAVDFSTDPAGAARRSAPTEPEIGHH
jgi:uncharacterized protein (TIGR03000 family)